MNRLLRIWPYLFLAATAILPTRQFVFGGEVPAPVDQVRQFAPWNEPATPPWDILQLDGALQFLPWRDLMLESLRDREVPLWNPYTLGGTPFLANSQSAPLYPLHLIWSLTPFGAEDLMRFSAWLHVALIGLGTFVLVRTLGGNVTGGILGAVAIQMSAFTYGWLLLPSVGMTAAWIPWVFACIVRLDRSRPGALMGLVASSAAMLLAGHLQIAAFGLMGAGILAIAVAVGARSLRPVAAMIVGVAIGGLLAAPQLIPSVQAGRSGHRSGGPSVEAWDGYKRQAVEPEQFLTLVAPTWFGLPNISLDSDPKLAAAKSAGLPADGTAFWLAYAKPGSHFAEAAFYVGPIVLPLFFFGLRRWRGSPGISGLSLIALFSVLVAVGSAVAQALFFYLPGWSATGSPGRSAVLFAIALCAVAGASVRDEREGGGRWRWLIGVVPLLLCAYGLASIFVGSPTDGGPIEALAEYWRQRSLVPVLIGLVGIGLAAACVARPKFAWAGIAFGTVASFWLFAPLNPGSRNEGDSIPISGLSPTDRVAVMNENWSLYTAAPGVIAPPNSLLPYRIQEVTGYDSIIPKFTKQRMDDVNGRDSAPEANGNIVFLKPGFDVEKLRLAGASHVLATASADLGSLERVASGNGWALYALPKPDWRVTGPGFTSVEVEFDRAAPFPFADREDWLEETDTGVTPAPERVEPGPHRYLYRPAGYRMGLILFPVGVLALFLIYWRGRAKSENAGNTRAS
ncbi:MAG: hypothetical protein HND42_10460 [Armatimonadetes bacterium]|nr:hypothetical protein [Armatimonadota bacterium]NOG93648.1 hypothetical protein [Armatimonadota bacterium]